MVSGHGRNSEIMLVGDYATEEDFANEKALTGYQEQVLKSMFREHNFHLEETYRTLYIKDRLTYYGRAKKKRDEALKEAFKKHNYNELLLHEIVTLKPFVIVPLGNLSLKFLTGEKSVERFRGSVLPPAPDLKLSIDHPIRVIPTLSPQVLNQDWTARVYCSLDIQKVIANKQNWTEIKQRELIWICKTAQELRNYFNRIRSCDFVTCDIETYCGIPTCIGFSHDGYEGVCVPLLDNSIDYANRILIWQLVSRFLASAVPKVNQNIKYDQTILERFSFQVNNIIFDTQIASGLIYPELPKNLGFLTSIYTEMPYFKDEGKEFDPTIHDRNRLYIYNAKDCISTWQTAAKQHEEIIELGMKPLMYGNVPDGKEPEMNPMGMMKLYHIYQKMDLRGIQVDDSARKRLIAKYESLCQVYETLLRNKIGDPKFNINSHVQVGEFVYEELKFPKRSKTTASGKSSYNTDEETLEDLYLNYAEHISREDAAEILETIIFIRKLYKILQTLNTPLHPDLRLRANSNLSGTTTGRTSENKTTDILMELVGRKIIHKRLGHSKQTIGKHGFKYQKRTYGNDLRSLFVPSPGCVLVEADLSQAEARVDAVLANDFDILPRFDDGIGIHRLTGSWFFNCDPLDIKKNTEEYHLAKIIRHAGERNIKAAHLSLMVHKPIEFCQQQLDGFHRFQPKIRGVFHTDVINFVRKNRHLVYPNGRRRDFFGRPNEQLWNEAISALPQGIVSDQNKFTMIPFYEDDNCFPWIYEGHDATMCELPKGTEMEFAARYKKIVEREIDFTNCSLSRDFRLKIPVEIQMSDTNWNEMVEVSL